MANTVKMTFCYMPFNSFQFGKFFEKKIENSVVFNYDAKVCELYLTKKINRPARIERKRAF